MSEQVTFELFLPNREHLEFFVGAGRWLQENSDFAGCGFDEIKVRELYVTVVENPDKYFGVFARLKKDGDAGQIVGMLFGEAKEYYFSREKMARDMGFGFFPKFQYLAKTALPEMLDMFEEWAQDVGAMETAISTSTLAHGDKLEKALHYRGYKTVGFTVKRRFA